MELTPEERQRIYEEEKARLEAQERLKAEARARDALSIPESKGNPRSDRQTALLIVFGVVVAFMLVLVGVSRRAPSQPVLSSQVETPAAPPELGAQWQYQQDEDAMGRGASYYATVQSANTVTFDFPYAGAQHATLTLRTHPRFGKDVILRIERGQFLCPSYDGCSVLVRFDDGEPQTYSASGASDQSTEVLFVQNYPRFVAAMLKASQVRISAEVYQEGVPVFEFDVQGFDVARYRATP